jgi:DNA-binding CsgD family transcriptional regulator
MTPANLETAKSLWREIAKHSSDKKFSLELDIHKKLLSIFHIGNFYYYIFNCAEAKIEYISESMSSILGHERSYFTVENLPNLIHPEDFPYFLSFEAKVTQFFTQLPVDQVMSYKVSYDYRMRKADEQYLRILHQVTTIQSDENGAVLRVLGVHTDITSLKKENGSTLSFIGLDGLPSYEDVNTVLLSNNRPDFTLSKREREVLQHLLHGKTSSQIAASMFISKETVDRHRKNMLKKTHSKSTAELSVRSIQENWA